MKILDNYEMTFTMTSAFINVDLAKSILGIGDSPSDFSISYTTIVQAKKHRKWRTNKKWLKRYGYKEVVVKSDGWNMKESGGGEFTFEKVVM